MTIWRFPYVQRCVLACTQRAWDVHRGIRFLSVLQFNLLLILRCCIPSRRNDARLHDAEVLRPGSPHPLEKFRGPVSQTLGSC